MRVGEQSGRTPWRETKWEPVSERSGRLCGAKATLCLKRGSIGQIIKR